MMEHLLSLGYRRIGFISGPRDSSASAARVRGYREALKSAKIRFDATCIAAGDLTEESGCVATKILLEGRAAARDLRGQ